jgi:hypothetical protein
VWAERNGCTPWPARSRTRCNTTTGGCRNFRSAHAAGAILESVKQYVDEVVIFGTIVAASIDADCQFGDRADQYFALRPIFFLEGSTYASVDTAKRVDRGCPTEQRCFIVQTELSPNQRASAVLATDHVRFLRGRERLGDY